MIEPTGTPATFTLLPLTSWLAFSNWAVIVRRAATEHQQKDDDDSADQREDRGHPSDNARCWHLLSTYPVAASAASGVPLPIADGMRILPSALHGCQRGTVAWKGPVFRMAKPFEAYPALS